MNKVTADKFHKDYCNVCIYKSICNENRKNACYKVSKRRKNYLASMLYGEPTCVVKK